MFRTVLSIVAVAFMLGAMPSAAAPGQTKDLGQAAPKPPLTVVNINTASASDFEALPGIGAKTATRIVDYRQKNGPFKKVEELMNIRGIGEKNFLKLKPQLTVATAKADHQDQQ